MDNMNIIVVFSLLFLCALASVSATIYLFTARKKEQRPRFVIIQMLLLNCFWISFLLYFGSIYFRFKDGIVVDEDRAYHS